MRLRAGDAVILGILGIVVVVLTFNLPAMFGAWLFHLALLAVYAVLIPFGATRPVLRAIATVGVLFTLYTTLATIPFEAIPWLADAGLSRADEILFFGTNPALWVEPYVDFGRLEFFSFIYGMFIPYVYFSIFIGLVGRPDTERNRFLTGLAVAYSLGYLGYLFMPARGPVVFLASEFAGPLQGGVFHDIVVNTIERCGGPHGAFPSLHVGGATYLCLFDLRWNRLRGLTYVPVVLLVMGATVVLRYHYVVDIIAGVFVAWVAFRVARAER